MTLNATRDPSMVVEPLTPRETDVLADRRRTIEAIREFNPTAKARFLAEFNTGALKDYLEHLRHRRHKHVRLAGWLERRTSRRMAA